MSNDSGFDRESFQQLLTSAFAVQQSQIDPQFLSAFVEIQRLIARDELDVDGVMNLIVESAISVANATGVAIGLLEEDQLIYRAGSGSAAADAGRQVRASLTASADAAARPEILRVENTDEDPRIQAAICRQLGAKSLLILPIYRQRGLAGVLELRFSEAHTFEDPEVQTYRLMAGLVEDAMFQASQLEREKAAEIFASPAGNFAPQSEMLFSYGSMPGPTGAIFERCGAVLGKLKESTIFKQPGLLTTALIQRAKDVGWRRGHRSLAFAGAATVLALTCWIAYRGHGPASPASSASTPTAIEQRQGPFESAKAVTATDTSTRLAKPAPGSHATAMRRVPVSDHEVDYIRGDVTVRHFTYKPAPQQRRIMAKSRVAHIGDDVTVRYFPSGATLQSASR
jgi:GAF domain